MKTNNQNKNDSYNKYLFKWLIVLLVIFPLGFSADFIAGKLSNNMFSIYFKLLVSNCIFIGGGLIWIIGCIIIQGLFLFSKRKYTSASICLIIFVMLSGWIYKSSFNGYIYQNIVSFINDFSYASSQTYCEKTDKLNRIYKSKSIGKGNYDTIFVETENNKYQIFDNIADEKSYDQFYNKFKKCENVKTKYLPNSNLLLCIEPENN